MHPKNREYLKELKDQAIKTYYSGASGREVGKLFKMSKANVYNWIKKTKADVSDAFEILARKSNCPLPILLFHRFS